MGDLKDQKLHLKLVTWWQHGYQFKQATGAFGSRRIQDTLIQTGLVRIFQEGSSVTAVTKL